MKLATPLPDTLLSGYSTWKSNGYEAAKDNYVDLADNGQKPMAMMISCCDSRVHATSVFGVDPGTFFMHRNIANLVPPYAPESDNQATASALEYAVTALGVSHVIVMGHSLCGGVNACHQKCSGHAPQLEASDSLVGKWIETLRPGFERVQKKSLPEADQIPALEREGVLMSLDNLMSFPFISERVEAGSLQLHGLWIDIRDGHLEAYDAQSDAFHRL